MSNSEKRKKITDFLVELYDTIDPTKRNSEKFIHYESQTIGKSLTYYKKMRQMYISKMYYHKTYNKINSAQVLVYKILNICRKIELLIEIPIRKILRK